MSDAEIRRLRREIASAPLCEPADGEYVGPCHWSRTQWAVYRSDGACTCRPANPPQVRSQAVAETPNVPHDRGPADA